jgi:predicted DNA-binding transcriptional regulator AlpA
MARAGATKAKAAKPKVKAARTREVPPGVPRLLTAAEVSDALGVTVRKLRTMIDVGQFPRSKSPKGMDPRWTTQDVAAWVDRHYGREGGDS